MANKNILTYLNIKLTIKLNPSTILDTKLTTLMVLINSMLISKTQNYFHHDLQNAIGGRDGF